MKVGSLFSGIGGFDLAAKWIGWETKWYSEIDPYAIRVMERHFPDAYNVGDITTFLADAKGDGLGAYKHSRAGAARPENGEVKPQGQGVDRHAIDILCGGFPCQPVSCAGKQLAQADPRWLWPHFARIIRTLRPRYVVAENVPGLLGRGATDVLRDFAALGYDVEWETIPASAVGAPHKRDRVWFLAYPSRNGRGELRRARERTVDVGESSRGIERQRTDEEEVHADADSGGLEGWEESHQRETTGQQTSRRGNAERFGVCGTGQWATEPDVGRVAHGVPSRVDRLKCLGNAIVPQIAYWIFQQIERREG